MHGRHVGRARRRVRIPWEAIPQAPERDQRGTPAPSDNLSAIRRPSGFARLRILSKLSNGRSLTLSPGMRIRQDCPKPENPLQTMRQS